MGTSRSFRDRLLSNVCRYDFVLYMAFVFQVVLLLFAVLSYLFADLDAETQAILLIDFVLLGVAFALTVALIFVCRRRQ